MRQDEDKQLVELKFARSHFGSEWLVFGDDGGDFSPDLLAFPLIAHALRNCLMKWAPQPPRTVLTGHEADGSPTGSVHSAIVPLSDVGWKHARGRLLGLAIVPPAGLNPDGPDAHAIETAARAFMLAGGELQLGRQGVWLIARHPDVRVSSLMPDRYCRLSRRWNTVAPLVLDRFPKPRDGKRAVDIVRAACINIGLPAPIEILLHNHSTIVGAPSVHPQEKALPPGQGTQNWRWPTDSHLAKRPLTHATVTFAEPVHGPVILGAGRFVGHGLCLAVDGLHGAQT